MSGVRFRTLAFTVWFLLRMPTADAQWQSTSIPSAVYTYSIITAGNLVFVGTDLAVFYSSNGGSSWYHPSNLGIDTAGPVYSLAMNDTFLFAGTSRQGVFRSADLGSSWESISTNLPTGQAMSLMLSDSGIFVGTNMGVFLSTNNGISW